MESRLYLSQFIEKFHDESICLQKIVDLRFPEGIYCSSCADFTPHHKLKKRMAYQCNECLHQFYPLAGTIFQKTRTPLKLWFYAMFVMVNTKAGIAAKTLQREIGVTYKTAWRMMMQIRKLMGEKLGLLKGIVEIDEAYIGGRGFWRGKKWWSIEEHPKDIVMGFVERQGRIVTKVIQDTSVLTMHQEVLDHVHKDAWVLTDQHPSYWNIKKYGYKHNAVNHSKRFVSKSNPEVHIQHIENFWSHLKRGITGVYRHVSRQHIQKYCDEFAFRYNHRNEQIRMFEVLLNQIWKFT